MISKDKITEIFCIADDFCKELEKEFGSPVKPCVYPKIIDSL